MLLRFVLLGTLFASCGGQVPPVWSPLAVTSQGPVRSGAVAADASFSLQNEADGLRAVVRMPAESFERVGAGTWRAKQPLLAIGRPPAGRLPYELELDDAPDRLEDYSVELGVVSVTLRGEDPPGPAELSAHAGHQAVDASGHYRIEGRRIGGAGFVVWPGQRVFVRHDVPARSALRFACVEEAARLGAGVRLQRHTYRVLLDGEPIFEHVAGEGFESLSWHTVPLPPTGRSAAELTFEVTGGFAYTAFLEPTIGPAEIGTYAERPWTTERRNVVVFLADTFRADNLAFYGGEHGRTPRLDAFVGEALAFRNAWSVSTHTLPAHSTLFSGMYPRQNGHVDFYNPLPSAVETLAETFTRHGYRTVAVTDGIMVSQTHGIAQGFGCFDERRPGLDATLERARLALDADDGRPLLLFVQSYATHAPYRLRAETRELLGERYRVEHDFDHWFSRLERVAGKEAETQLFELSRPGTREAADEIARMYAASAFDLDRAFASFRELLRERSVLARGALVFTSDHGEALGEHGRIFHAGVPFEEVLRIPLLIAGDGVEPGVVDRSVSLVDLPPTIFELAGLSAQSRGLMGRSLLGVQEERPVFAFQCRGDAVETTLAVIQGRRKLIGFEDREARKAGPWWRAFDLEHDPHELDDQLATGAEWALRMGAEVAPLLPPLLTPDVPAESVNLSGDQRRELGALGYVETSGK